MKALVLVMVDVPEMLPDGIRGSQVISVDVTMQTGNPDSRYMRRWHLGEIEARVVEIEPTIRLEPR